MQDLKFSEFYGIIDIVKNTETAIYAVRTGVECRPCPLIILTAAKVCHECSKHHELMANFSLMSIAFPVKAGAYFTARRMASFMLTASAVPCPAISIAVP